MEILDKTERRIDMDDEDAGEKEDAEGKRDKDSPG